MWTSTDCSPIDFCLQNYNFSTNPQEDGENSIATNCHWLFVLHELPLMYHELSLIVWGYCIRVVVGTAAMSCQRGQVRWWASFATRRSSAPLHNLLKNPSPLRGWATAPYTFTTTDNTPSPCRHGGQGSAISYAPGTHPCRRFASSRGGTTKRSIYARFM